MRQRKLSESPISLPLKLGNDGACLTGLWGGLYDKTHTKSAEQRLELTNQSLGIHVCSALEIPSTKKRIPVSPGERAPHPTPHVGKPTMLIETQNPRGGFQKRGACPARLPLGQEPESPGAGLARPFAGPIAKLHCRAFHSESVLRISRWQPRSMEPSVESC